MGRRLFPLVVIAVTVGAGAALALLREVPRTEPNQVVEIAPGVYFRHGDLEGKGHCNHGIVIFRDFVLVIDGNFPSGAEACLADVRKITDKPVRFVFNTHHHGDHAYGNPIWLKQGAIPIAHQGVASEMARLEPKRWREAKREDVTALGLDRPQPPIVTFPDRMVIDDGTQRVELLHYGTAHTRGDGFAYLSRQRVLFTGDAVVNGPYNFMGDGDSASWVKVIESLERLDVEIVGPGHGPLADRSLLPLQRRFFEELRARVGRALRAGSPLEGLAEKLRPDFPADLGRHVGDFWKDQVAKVAGEMLGLEMPLELVERGFEAGPSPAKEDPSWKRPAKVLLAQRPEWLEDLQRAAPSLKLVAVKDRAAILAEAADADAILGGNVDAEVLRAAPKLAWIQTHSAGVNQFTGAGAAAPGIPGFAASTVVLTNARRCYGPNIADQVFAYLLAFTRGIKPAIEGRDAVRSGKEGSPWKLIDRKPDVPETELRGKTMLLLGAGGIGSEVARRAQAFGMEVLAVDPKVTVPPLGVTAIFTPERLREILPRAFVLVVACPYTEESHGRIGSAELAALPAGSYLINVARGPIVAREALIDALRSGHLRGAGLDVTDPEPLPADDPLWRLPNVIITPHNAGPGEGSGGRIFLLWRENLRRFAAGEPLLNVVDKKVGY